MQLQLPSLPYDILHVSAGCWVNGAGLSEAVALLALAQAKAGKRIAVTFLDDHPEHPTLMRCRAAGVDVFPIHRASRDPFYFSVNFARALSKLIHHSAEITLHGAWTFPIAWAAHCARKQQVPYAVFSHGSLDPVRRAYGKRRKTIAWRLFDRKTLLDAQQLYATSEREAQWLRDALAPSPCPPITIIPIGVDTELLDTLPEQPRKQIFLYLGRNHPLKGLDLLLDAWQQTNLSDGWELHLAGNIALPHPLPKGVQCIGEIHGKEKVMALKSATALVLPTRSENYGIVVAEALWCKTPVICTKGAPWEILGDFWVDISSEALADALQRMAALTPEARAKRFAPLFVSIRETFSR